MIWKIRTLYESTLAGMNALKPQSFYLCHGNHNLIGYVTGKSFSTVKSTVPQRLELHRGASGPVCQIESADIVQVATNITSALKTVFHIMMVTFCNEFKVHKHASQDSFG